MTKRIRKIVTIDEDKCDGCGLCIPSCAEGAIRIVDGKARLIADNLCDGLGMCLGTCPQDAIHVIEREADEFDEEAVTANKSMPVFQPAEKQPPAGGCPGAALRNLARPAPGPLAGTPSPNETPSRLGQWPVQLALLPPVANLWNQADVLVAADCVPFAMAGFHDLLLDGKTLAIACPKLDDVRPYVDKLTTIFASNPIKSIQVAIMEVPCCRGLAGVVMEAAQSARLDVPVEVVIVGVDGTIRQRTTLEAPHNPSARQAVTSRAS